MKTLLGYTFEDGTKSSGPNYNGYYMGQDNSLMGMQTGGMARLAQARQRRKDDDLMAARERAEARRQRKSGLFGGIGRTLGSLAGSVFGPAGTAAGSYLGSKIGRGLSGAGKGISEKEAIRGTVYKQDRFKDISKASKAFDKQQRTKDLMSAGTAALAAGVGDGGFYGRINRAANPVTSSISVPFNSTFGQTAASSIGTLGMTPAISMPPVNLYRNAGFSMTTPTFSGYTPPFGG